MGGVSASQASAQSGVGSAAVGTALGAGNAQYAGHGVQRRYDVAYVQCMYASGHRVPVYGPMAAPLPPQNPPPGSPQ